MRKAIKKCCTYLLTFSLVLSSSMMNAYARTKMSVKLNKVKVTMTTGKSIKLKASIKNKRKGSKLVWKSSDSSVVSIGSNGTLKARKAGKAKVTVKIKGKSIKAVCIVTVKNKKSNATSTQTPSVSITPAVTTTPAATTTPTATQTPVATVTPECTATATASPNTTNNDDQSTTDSTSSPGSTAISEADATESPAPSVAPTQTVAPTSAPTITSTAVKDIQVANVDGEIMTVYIVDKSFDGTITIAIDGYTTTQTGSAKDVLLALKATYATKSNSDNTITISRVKPETYWTIKNNITGVKYYLRAETNNTFDTSYSNCGAIYFKGDVTSSVSVY